MNKAHRLLALIQGNASATPRPLATATSAGEAHIYLYDVIDAYWGLSAKAFADAVNAVPAADTLHVHINSPGGDAFEGRAMAAALAARSGSTIVHVEGIAASAATTVALAGTQVRMFAGSLFMVHNSWTMAWGNKDDLQDTIKLLALVDRQLAADYRRKTGASEEQVKQWMDDETWFDAQAAKDAGFVDAIDEPGTADASGTAAPKAKAWNLSAYTKAPTATAPVAQPAQAKTSPDPDITHIAAQQRARNERRLQLLTLC